MRIRQLMKSIAAWGLALGLLGSVAVPQASAQVGSSSRSVGSTISGGNRSAFGGSSSSGTPGATSGTSGSLLGTLGNTATSSGSLGITRSSGSFVGSDNSDANFVGANSTGGARTGMGGIGGLGGGLNGGFGGLSGLGGMSGFGSSRGGGMFGASANSRNRNNMNAMGRGNTRQINVRTQLDVGFRYTQRPATRVETTLVKMLNSKRIARTGDLAVQLENGTATLTGRVATRSDRDLAVRLAKQEPGVQKVLDQLVVESPDEDALSPSDDR